MSSEQLLVYSGHHWSSPEVIKSRQFDLYPKVGGDKWKFTYATLEVRRIDQTQSIKGIRVWYEGT